MATLKNTVINDTGFINIPAGDETNRPATNNGRLRFNTATKQTEYYERNKWNSFSKKNTGIATTGLVGHYDFGNPECYDGSNTVNDISTTNNTGTINGDVVYYPENGGYLRFNESNNNTGYIGLGRSYISTGEIGSGEVSYTLEAWVWMETFSGLGATTSGMSIVGNASNVGTGMQMAVSGGQKLNFAARSNSNFNSASEFTNGRWYHVVCSREAGNSNKLNRIYINGRLDELYNTRLEITNTSSEMQIGWAQSRVDANKFRGKIAIVRLYNRFLTDAEVAKNFVAEAKRFGVSGKWGVGYSPENAASNLDVIQAFNPDAENGYYYLQPDGVGGEVVKAFCDFDGSTGPLGPGWVRVRYDSNSYSRGSPWRGTGLSSPSNPAVSQNFNFDTDNDAGLQRLSRCSTDIRQRFESYGYGSVGWTYGSYYQTHYDIDGRWWSGNGGQGQSIYDNRPSSVSYGFTDYETFNNPRGRGTDPTDNNDSTWRVGIIYVRDTGALGILPIKRIAHADVDGSTEQRYFPIRTGEYYLSTNTTAGTYINGNTYPSLIFIKLRD